MATTTRNRKPRTDRADELAKLHANLTDAVATLADSDQWRAWLDLAARFHAYSLNNTVLIWTQRPDATHVAGYRTWQQLGRQVRKGERGIRILAPMVVADREARAAGDEDATKLLFRAVSVFDVAQTDGDPLPQRPAVAMLDGDAPAGLWQQLADYAHTLGYTIALGGSDEIGHPHALGVCHHTDRTIVVRDSLGTLQQAKTLAHEIAHAVLHNPSNTGRPDNRAHVEVEAESAAYLILGAHGIETDDYSLGYVTDWARGDVQAIERTAARVLACAHQVLDVINPSSSTTDEETSRPK